MADAKDRPTTDPARRLVDAFRWLDPGPYATHLVSDVSGWWRDPDILAGLGPALAALCPDVPGGPTLVVGPETSGFIVGPLVATALGTGFAPAYKRAPRGELVVVTDRLRPGDRVLVADDWVETGGQVAALRHQVRSAGAAYLGTVAVVDATTDQLRADLRIRALLRRADLD